MHTGQNWEGRQGLEAKYTEDRSRKEGKTWPTFY